MKNEQRTENINVQRPVYNHVETDNPVKVWMDGEVVDAEIIENESSESNAYKIYEKCIGLERKKKRKKRKKRKKEKKERKKKKKKEHKKLYRECDSSPPYIPLRNALSPFYQYIFESENAVREGYNIPSSLIFNPSYESAFFFGKTPDGKPVGKSIHVDGHIAVFGGSGSGKTTGIAIPNMKTWNGAIFSFDFKGDLINQTGRTRKKILYLLRGADNKHWYDPFYLLRQDGNDDLVQNARELAHAIIPLPSKVPDPFWIKAARNILTSGIVYYFRLGASFIEAMMEIRTTKMSVLLEKFSQDNLAAVCLDPDLDTNPKLLSSVSNELRNYIAVFVEDSLIRDVFSPSEDESKKLIRWEELAFGYSIFIRVDQSRLDQWTAVMRLMIVQLIRTLERRPEKYDPTSHKCFPTLLMLDEFPQYGKIDPITSALKILRSKDVTIAIFCQSLADLDVTYGKDIRSTILDNCPYKVILNSSDADTQRYFSELVGTTKHPSRGFTANYDKSGKPSGYSVTINEARVPIIQPHEFASLQDIVLLHPETERFCRIQKETYFRRSLSQPSITERSQ